MEDRHESLVSLYGHIGGAQTVITGYILYMTEEELLMAKISSRGGYDGFVLQRPKYFFRAETDGSRERRMGTLYLHKKKSHGRIFKLEQQTCMDALLRYAKEQGLLMNFNMDEDGKYSILGFIQDFSKNFIKIQKIDQDGFVYLDVQKIVSCRCDTAGEQDILLLNRVNC